MIVVRDNEQVRVDGRIAQMIAWLLARCERVSASNNIAITFNCAGPNVSAEVKERERLDAALLRCCGERDRNVTV